MKYLAFFLLALITTDPIEITRVNALKKEAEKAFLSEDYTTAIEKYKILKDSFAIEDDEVFLNLGHAYTKLSDTAQARSMYSQASMSSDKSLKSIAYQQLGVLSKNPSSYQESLQYLKSSLKTDPSNLDARYDYEVVRKLLEQQQQQQNQDDQNKKDQEKEDQKENEDQQQQNQDQQNKDQQENQDKENQEQQNEQDKENQEEQENKEQEQESEQQEKSEEEKKKEQEMATKKKLEEMNISEEKAKMILEAMRNAEIQYLQQQKRKATEKPKSGKPDW